MTFNWTQTGLTIGFTSEEQAALKYAADKYNASQVIAPTNETPRQFFERHIRHLAMYWIDDMDESTKVTRSELYQRASPIDKGTIDAILDKYK